MDLDILEMDTTDIVEPRNAPEGRYLATYVSYESADKPKGKEVVMNWRLDSPLDSQDMTGVNLARLIEGKVFMNQNTVPFVKRDFHTGFNYEPPAQPKQWFEDNIGKTAIVIVTYDTWWKEKRGVEKPVVRNWTAA